LVRHNYIFVSFNYILYLFPSPNFTEYVHRAKMADDSSEVSVGNCYCVVYKLVNQDWVVTGEGWAQVHLYRDDSDNSHRIVGWTVNDSNVSAAGWVAFPISTECVLLA